MNPQTHGKLMAVVMTTCGVVLKAKARGVVEARGRIHTVRRQTHQTRVQSSTLDSFDHSELTHQIPTCQIPLYRDADAPKRANQIFRLLAFVNLSTSDAWSSSRVSVDTIPLINGGLLVLRSE